MAEYEVLQDFNSTYGETQYAGRVGERVWLPDEFAAWLGRDQPDAIRPYVEKKRAARKKQDRMVRGANDR